MKNRAIGIFCGISAASALLLTGCSSTPELTGMWTSTGPSQSVAFYEDGSCSGMMNVDIGGPMYCALSDKESDGYFTLRVSQGENSAQYLVKADGDDHLEVFDTGKAPLYELDRL